jgi:polygalacturonase
VVPSDITIRGNYFHKPIAWKGVWSVKNSFELKAGRRVLVEQNRFRRLVAGRADGLRLGAQGRHRAHEDITMRNNVVRNVGAGVGFEGNTPNNLVRVRVEGNLFERVNVPARRTPVPAAS